MSGDYSAIAAKIKAIESGGLTYNDYEQILLASSVVDVFTYLASNTGYKTVLSELSNEDMHRSSIERKLRHEMLREYGRIYSFMDTRQKRVFEFWFLRREIEFLKRAVLHLYNNEQDFHTETEDELEEFFRKHTKMDCDIVKSAQSVEQLIEGCKNTSYHKVLKRAQNINADYFSVSMMLDSFYFESLWRAKDRYLNNKDITLFSELMGTKIDMLNIIWVYRGIKYFNMRGEILVTNLIPIRYRLSSDAIRSITLAPSAEDVIRSVSTTAYSDVFENIEQGVFPEENMNRIYVNKARQCLLTNPESMAAVYSYFDLKENEIYNITTLIEGIRYKLDSGTVRRHMNIC